MDRYIATAAVPWIVSAICLCLSLFSWGAAGVFSWLNQLMFWVSLPCTGLGLWGVAAIWIAEQQEVLKGEEANIDEDSWYYRMNQRVEGEGWTPPSTECQYWALTFNNMIVGSPLLGVILFWGYSIKFLIAWPLGLLWSFVPDWENWKILPDGHYWFENQPNGYDDKKHQKEGPVLVGLVLFGLAAALIDWFIPAFAGGLILVAVIVALAKPIWWVISSLWNLIVVSTIGGICAFVLMRFAGVCRPAKYISHGGAATP